MRYETWEQLWDATVLAEPDSKPLVVTIFPPVKREKYIAMHMPGLGYTDTRWYRWGNPDRRRARSERYGLRMVQDYIAIHFDLTVPTVVHDGPKIVFEWSPLPWQESDLGLDD